MNVRAEPCRYAAIDCLQVDSGDAPELLVVLCHGYGAPGTDLVPLAVELDRSAGLGAEGRGVRYLFPQALLSLDDQGIPGGRAWWALNMQQLFEAVAANDFSELCVHTPPGLQEAREQLSEAIQAAAEQAGLAANRLVLGGFSQGAMLTMDVALRGLPEPPAGLLQFSGSLICEPQWRAAAARLAGCPVVQTHGTVDPILPFAAAEALRDLLTDAGAAVQFLPFHGPHTIPYEAIGAAGGLIRAVGAIS